MKKQKKHPSSRDGIHWLMRRPKRTLAEQLATLTKKLDRTLGELATAQAKIAAFDARADERAANAKRLAFLQSRHTALEEWANAARRTIYAFPGVTNE